MHYPEEKPQIIDALSPEPSDPTKKRNTTLKIREHGQGKNYSIQVKVKQELK